MNKSAPVEDFDLRRSTPYLARTGAYGAAFCLDKIALGAGQVPHRATIDLVEASLDLSRFGRSVDHQLAVLLVEEQYEASLEHVFGHPLWQEFREGKCREGLLAYLLETRHYLHAALWRMQPAISTLDIQHPLFDLLYTHAVEEADHARFFENALVHVGIPATVSKSLRPLPATVEWVHLMRFVARGDPLCAALCSGLMEHSAGERGVVKDWHTFLAESSLLPKDAVRAIYEHIAEDLELGHGGMWRKAIEIEDSIATERLARILNNISIVAEAIFRWLSALRDGCVGSALAHAADTLSKTSGVSRGGDTLFRSDPTWQAVMYDEVTRSDARDGAASAIGIAFLSGGNLEGEAGDFAVTGSWLARKLRSPAPQEADLFGQVTAWLGCIEGHRLWQSMQEEGSDALVTGWILENFVYLRSARVHVPAAIASCDDAQIRDMLFEHLVDEAHHDEILRQALVGAEWFEVPEKSRPLSTTLAFTGWLADLANRDWAAYCIALYFLQRTLEPGADQHSQFYKEVSAANPGSARTLAAMRQHDEIDGKLGHEQEMQELMQALIERGYATDLAIARASMVAPMSWSFLDGIWETYRHGDMALAQRIGWHMGEGMNG